MQRNTSGKHAASTVRAACLLHGICLQSGNMRQGTCQHAKYERATGRAQHATRWHSWPQPFFLSGVCPAHAERLVWRHAHARTYACTRVRARDLHAHAERLLAPHAAAGHLGVAAGPAADQQLRLRQVAVPAPQPAKSKACGHGSPTLGRTLQICRLQMVMALCSYGLI